MLFNSNFFLYVFLPSLLFLYFVVPYVIGKLKHASENDRKHTSLRTDWWHNGILIIYSLAFYYFTAGKHIWVLLCVVAGDYFLAKLIATATEKTRKAFLAIGVVFNISFLLYFKYTGFLLENLSFLIPDLGSTKTMEAARSIALPIGISFFTFQSMSYLIDVYRGKAGVQNNPLRLLLYVSLFPQLVAGPIVRYETVNNEIKSRSVTWDDVYVGVSRFIIGLGKKVLIADFFGSVVDNIYALDSSNLTTSLAWTAAFLYALQIYYDFSAYSDMAIGMGRIFGFHFLENFTLPYSAENITDFWRRWHISLSSFLRDYLYIPLGGNRKGSLRTYQNLIVVFLVCGFWHGAAWTFILWGIYHGCFMLLERLLKKKYKFEMKGVFGKLLTFFVVMMGWVLFRAESLEAAGALYRVMFGSTGLASHQYYSYRYFVTIKTVLYAVIAFLAAFFSFDHIRERINRSRIKYILLIAVLVLSMAFMADASFTPFIYFQF